MFPHILIDRCLLMSWSMFYCRRWRSRMSHRVSFCFDLFWLIYEKLEPTSLLGTIVKLRQMSKKRSSSSTNLSKRDIEVTKQVAVVGILFVILSATFSVFVILKLRLEVVSDYTMAKHELYNAIETFCSGLNNSINFYAYFAFGKKFRNDVLALFGVKQTPEVPATAQTAASGGAKLEPFSSMRSQADQ